MNRRSAIFLLSALAILSLAAWYLHYQDAKIWCDRQWAGLALYRGGYRSWTLTFADGFTLENGKQVPITIDRGKGVVRRGYHWPQFAHTDIRPFLFGLANGSIKVTNYADVTIVNSSTNWIFVKLPLTK
jgi:hypothetical protein